MLTILKTTIGNALYFKRIEFGLSQNRMAEKCCISVRQYNDLENGKRLPKIQTFINISIKCNLNMNAIIDEVLNKGYHVDDDINSL